MLRAHPRFMRAMKRSLAITLSCSIGPIVSGQDLLQQITSTGGVACEQFGHGLAFDGERIVVGAAAAADDPPMPCASGPGSAYVFDHQPDGGGWVQKQRLAPIDGGSGDEFGNSVAVCGDRIVIGSEHHDGAAGSNSGAAYVYERQGTTWTLVAKLEPSDAEQGQYFARSVAISGDWIVCGTRFDSTLGNQAGAAYTFQRDDNGVWVETQKLLASDGSTKDLYGNSCSIDGNTLVVGSYQAAGPGGNKQGVAYVYELQGLVWVETQKLQPTPATSPAEFGRSVSIHGDRILVGARADSGPGAAYVFERQSSWVQTARLTPSHGQSGDQFGESVSICGDNAVVGSRLANNLRGRAFLYEKQDTGWVETELAPPNPAVHGWHGYNVGASASGCAVGAPFDLDARGSAAVYSVPDSEPTDVNYCTAGVSASGCQAIMGSSGSASATASSGFVLQASGVEGLKDGLFFFGNNGRQANSWGNGTSFQCVAPPLIRAPVMTATGTLGACDGSFSLDLNALWCSACPKPAKNPGAGALVQSQLWYRDPASTSNQTTSLSDAREFSVGPR